MSNIWQSLYLYNNITTEKRWKDGLHVTNSGKVIIIKNFVPSLNRSHFFLTKQPNSKILFQFLKRRTFWTKVINLFRRFCVIAYLNLNLVVEIRVILLMLKLGSKT